MNYKNNRFYNRSQQLLRNICKEQGFVMKKSQGRHHWFVEDAKGRHHAMAWEINYDKGSGYFVVRYPAIEPGDIDPAKFSLRTDSDIALFFNIMVNSNLLRAKRRQ